MIKITNPADCCGCTACASICNHDAIKMKPDALGFLYPEVDADKCTNCGLCEKVCAFNQNYNKEHLLPEIVSYGARHKNDQELQDSRSGAAFIAISDILLDRGGVVYGAGYADHFRVVHKRATTKEERDEFKGSKYVQSDMQGILPMIKNDLRNGRSVLFSGTPCQTAAVRSFVGDKLSEHLFLLDIICHAVPSPYIWRDYIGYLEKRTKEKIKNLSFRDKRFGWNAEHNEAFEYESGKYETNCLNRDLFYKSLDTRQSCHNCYYCNLQRPSDLTIGDFWGYENTEACELNKGNKGISLLLVNSEKGRTLLEDAKKDLLLIQTNLADSLQPNLSKPTPSNPLRDNFEYDYSAHGFKYIARKYSVLSEKYIIKQTLRKIKNRILCTVKYR